MTLEEAIVNLEKLIALFHTASEQSKMVDYSKIIETLEFAATALRPVSREQVEKVWKGAWKYSHTSATDHFAVVKCSKCGHEAYAMALHVIEGNFCPACGAPMTDEAVEMVMERLEALYGEKESD